MVNSLYCIKTHANSYSNAPTDTIFCFVLHDKVLVFVNHHFQKCTNQLGRKSKAGSIGGKAGQGLLKTSVPKPTEGGGEESMNTGFNEREGGVRGPGKRG